MESIHSRKKMETFPVINQVYYSWSDKLKLQVTLLPMFVSCYIPFGVWWVNVRILGMPLDLVNKNWTCIILALEISVVGILPAESLAYMYIHKYSNVFAVLFIKIDDYKQQNLTLVEKHWIKNGASMC
jgi:hypothetical protein